MMRARIVLEDCLQNDAVLVAIYSAGPEYIVHVGCHYSDQLPLLDPGVEISARGRLEHVQLLHVNVTQRPVPLVPRVVQPVKSLYDAKQLARRLVELHRLFE